MYSDLTTLCVERGNSIRDAISRMDKGKVGIVLVVDAERRLLGTVTDGDIRRALLSNVALREPVCTLLARKAGTRYALPITARAGQDSSTYLSLLKQHNILHLPLVDNDGRVVGLIGLDDFVPDGVLPLQAVVMAGGAGSRMRPLTEELPKPMLPVGDRPLMEIIIQQLRDAGIKRVNVTTHHQSEKITEHFGDGRNFGVELSYVTEDRPLGTAGALGLMEKIRDTVLVINGDILTKVDFRTMVAFHREHHADLTLAVRRYDVHLPYGVVDCEGISVRRLKEKPSLNFLVNAGIYLLEPTVYRYIPNGERFDMTDLIQRLLDAGRPVVSFPIWEYWLDIGEPNDYERAQEDVKHGKLTK